MGEVSTAFKDLVECPCGCGAFGRLNPKTGHVVTCDVSCATCARPKKKSKPAKRVPPTVKRQLAARAKGLCEARCAVDCMKAGVHPHHKKRTGQGRDDSLSNLLWVCLRCHDWIHNHISEAVKRGFLASKKEFE